MTLNLNIYQHIMNNGLTISNPAVNAGRETSNQLMALEMALNNPALDLLGIDLTVLTSARDSIASTNTNIIGSVNAMATTADNAIQMSSMAQQVNRLDAMSSGISSSCSNTTELFGSIQGENDAAFAIVYESARALVQGIIDVMGGLIALDEFETLLTTLSDYMSVADGEISSLLSKEAAKVLEIKNKITSSAIAQTIAMLWDNPCSKAVMNDVLPDEIKRLLP
ncbi:hypothetical protein PVK64_12520 [Aliivibrio sp. S4TY2]|uniref:DUF7217 family protein n=1 Tax=unclassified Aliivibrio TaxID=2645654 RepID=UPI00237807D0|nr:MULTISPECIES: hypothetical protein [unclassified Aliivibrio]MDD9157001.1 hypothetical protein [Aliivibrio sp. S4TY2]MDD9160785.1 hypothetical protein [Aliivibrio sp. S4TY1]MDD9164814.1 hypothetical protein [Aliivibrio sp. S4MY2]MDD9168911.1 hypothetical protein [Aliivibrio sp. S4MY4]MDD9185439.1 hypothetical protein [Aliivibrio sp. S4MY3]